VKTCINGATTMPYSLEDDIKSAGKAGFQGVEIWKDKLDRYLQNRQKSDLKDLISSHNVEVFAICPFSGYVWLQQDELTKKIEEMKRYLGIASYIGCESLLMCAEARKDKTSEEIIEAHANSLIRLAEICEDYGVKLALEWFQDLKDAIKIVESAAYESLGLMIDTFHWYRGDGNLDHIDLVPRSKLVLVHINDCEDVKRENLADKNRLYCGRGVIPLVEILRKLERKGYEGYLSVEIFRDEYWKRDPLTISKESLQTLKKVMKQAKLIR